MSSFTEKIYEVFSTKIVRNLTITDGSVMAQDQWQLGQIQNDTLLNYVMQFEDIEPDPEILIQEAESLVRNPSKFFPLIRDLLVDNNKKDLKPTTSVRHDSTALKNIGFASPEQNLKTLLSLDRQSIQRGVIASHLEDGKTMKRLMLLLLHLAETNYQNNLVAKPPPSTPLSVNFKDEVLPISGALQKVRNDLLTLDFKEQTIERYLCESSECQQIYNFQAQTYITQEQMQLDLICRRVAQNSQSAQVMVYLAGLTGNVAYLVRAIRLLLQNKDQYLRPEQVLIPSIRSLEIVKRSSDRTIIVQKQDMEELSNKHRILKLCRGSLKILLNTETMMFEIENQDQSVHTISSFRQIDKEYADKIGMSLQTSSVCENETSSQVVLVYYLNQTSDSLDFSYSLLDTQKFTWNTQTDKIWPKHTTQLVHKLAETSRIDAIRIWASDIGQQFVTFLVQNKSAKDNQVTIVQSQLVTFDLTNRCQWTINVGGIANCFEIIEQYKVAAVILHSSEEGQKIVFKNLMSGNYQKSLNAGDGDQFEVKIHSFDKKQQIGTNLPKNRPKKQTSFNGHWLWITDNTKLVLKLADSTWQLSNGDQGTFECQDSTIAISKNSHLVTYKLSDDSYTLTANEQLQGWPKIIQRCVAKSLTRDIDSSVLMNEYILSKSEVKLDCQFDICGGGTGKEHAINLIDPTKSDWCKWCAVNCANSQSWVLFDLNKEIDIDGIGFVSANDFQERDPQFAEIHYMLQTGEWVYFGALKLNFNQRHQTVVFGFQQSIRAKAMILNIGKYTDQVEECELQLGQIKLLQDKRRFSIQIDQNYKNEPLEILTLPQNPESSVGSIQVLDYKNSKSFSIALQQYPLQDDSLSNLKRKREEKYAAEYFGLETPMEETQKMTSFEWALYLAKLIDSHTKVRQNQVAGELKVRWLHKQPSKFYFEEIADLLTGSTYLGTILQYLQQNIADNLNAFVLLGSSDLSKVIDRTKLKYMIKKHTDIQPFIINHYRKACPSLSQTLPQFVQSVDIISLKFDLSFQFQTTCEQILNSGSLENFFQTWKQLGSFDLVQYQLGLLLAVGYAIKRLDTVLNFDMINFLMHVHQNPETKPLLVKDVERVMRKIIAQQFLKHVNSSRNSTYDHKGYLVTQSELLSGGINEQHLRVFSEQTLVYAQGCAKLIEDERLNSQNSKIRDQVQKEVQMIDTVVDQKQGIYFAIIHSGKNQLVDEICAALQTTLISKGGLIAMQSQVGQESGMKLVRAAFASMVKLVNQAQDQFQELYDEMELLNGEDIPLELGAAREREILDICTRFSHLQSLLKLWTNATKMRSWLTAKIKSVSQKYQHVTAEQDNQGETTHMQKIYNQIIDKADLLIKLDPPKQQVKAEMQINKLQRTPSYIPPKFATIQIQEQTRAQITQAKNDKTQEAGYACIASVLSCLQSPVLAIEIQNQIENSYLEAIKRLTGLTLLNKFLSNLETNSKSAVQVVKILQRLQKKDGKLSHYLDGISGGCNLVLEEKIRNVFFEILEKLSHRLQCTQDYEEAYTLVYSFQWGYHARDFDQLKQKVEVFNTLTRGESPSGVITQTWCKLNSPHKTLSQDLILSFKDIFMTVLARVSDPVADLKTQLKTFGNENLLQSVPKLVKVRSQLDENSSSLLVDSALRAIFRYLDSFCVEKQKLEQMTITEKLAEEIKSKRQEMHAEKQNFELVQQLLTDHTQVKSFQVDPNQNTSVLDLANIEVIIDTTSKEKQLLEPNQNKKKQLNETEQDLITMTREWLIKTFVTGSESEFIVHLLDCIQIMTSVSRQSQNAAKLLKIVASPYYVRTLLQLLEDLSQELKFRVLQLIDDLVSIDVALVEFRDENQRQNTQIYDSSIANFLYHFARKSLQSKHDFVLVKTAVKILRKLDIAEKHTARLQGRGGPPGRPSEDGRIRLYTKAECDDLGGNWSANGECLIKTGGSFSWDNRGHNEITIQGLQEMDPCDQILSLMICNCQAELESWQPGDIVCLTTNDLPIQQNFILVKSGKTCQVFCPNTGLTQSHNRQFLRLVHQGQPICYPDHQTVSDMIQSDKTIPVVKAVLINLVLRNKDRYQPILHGLRDYIEKYIVEDYIAQRNRESDQWDATVSVYLTEEIEDKCFHQIYQELKKPPAQVPLQVKPQTSSALKRNLIKTFFKPKTKKQDKYHNTVEECAYYDLFQVRDTVYHLIENPLLKNDLLVKLKADLYEFPMKYEKYSKLLVKNRVQRVRRIFESWGDQQKFKTCIQKSQPLNYRNSFSNKFKFILTHEAHQTQQKKQVIPIRNYESENLLYQRMSELLFDTYIPPVSIVDDEVLWHLNRFFMQKSSYLFIRNQSARSLNKRWFEIVNTCDLEWVKHYIRRVIRHGFSDSEVIWQSDQENSYFYLLMRPIRIVYKLIVTRYEQLAAEFLPDFCEIMFRHLVATRTSQSSYFTINRKNMHMVQCLLTLVQQQKDIQVFKVLIANTMLLEFTEQASKQKLPLCQFSYIGRLIQFQLVEMHKQFTDQGKATIEMKTLSEDNKLSLLIAEYEKGISRKDMHLLVQMSESQQEAPVFDDFVEIQSQHFGQWHKIKEAILNPEVDWATLKLVVLEGSGFSLIAISDEPRINKNTRYRVIKAGNKQTVATIKVQAKNDTFVMFPVDKAFVLKYEYFQADLKFQEDQVFDFDVDDGCQIYAFTGLVGRSENKSWLFASSKQGLYLSLGNGQFQEVKGFQGGKVVMVQQVCYGSDNEYFAIQTDQQQFYQLSTEKLMKKQKPQRQSYYIQNQQKVFMVVTSVQQNDTIHTFKAITTSNEVISLIAETVIDLTVSVSILRDTHQAITLECQWTDENKKVLKGKGIYLKVQRKENTIKAQPLFMKEKFYSKNQQIDFIQLISNSARDLFAVVADGYFDLWSPQTDDQKPKLHAYLPQNVGQVTQVHLATQDYWSFSFDWSNVAFFLETQQKLMNSSTNCIYWAKPNPNFSEITQDITLDFTFFTDQKFARIYSGFGRVLAIDQEGEIWSFYDSKKWFTQISEEPLDPLQKTNLMKQRMSKAVDLSFKQHIHNRKDKNSPGDSTFHVMIVVKCQNVITETKTQESFVCIAQKEWECQAWEAKVSFDLNQIYYKENKYLEQSDNQVMEIVSESITMGHQFFLVKPNLKNAPALMYKIFDPNTPSNNGLSYKTEEIESTKEFLNNMLKKLKLRRFLIGIMKNKQLLQSFLKDAIPNTEGHDQQLVQIIITANQFLFDSLPVTRAKSHDFKYSQMQDYIQFAEKYALPIVMQSIILFIQKTIKPSDGNYDSDFKVRFQRLNSTEKLFDQLYRQTNAKATKLYTFKLNPERPFRSRFVGENAYDAGGPFRDVLDDICAELSQSYFTPTSNMEIAGDSSYQPRLLTDVDSLSRFQYIGKMIGWSLRQWRYNLSLDMNPLFWKRICGLPVTLADLKEVDKYRYQFLQGIKEGEYSGTFEVDLGTGQEVLLCPNGDQMQVTAANSQLFIDIYLQKYLEQDQVIHDAIRRGIESVCPRQILRHLTAQAASYVAFSTPRVSVDELLGRIQSDEGFTYKLTRELFDRMIKEFTNKERQLLLKFITGSSRLTSQGHTIYINHSTRNHRFSLEEELAQPELNEAHKEYPMGHTCGKSVDLPDYTNYEIMCARFRTAIISCGEIDDDANYYDSEQDRGEGEGESDDGENSENSSGEGEGETESDQEGEGEDESHENSQDGTVRTDQYGNERSRSHNSDEIPHTSYHSNNSNRSRSNQFYGGLMFEDESGSDGNGYGENEESERSYGNQSSGHSYDSQSQSEQSYSGDSWVSEEDSSGNESEEFQKENLGSDSHSSDDQDKQYQDKSEHAKQSDEDNSEKASSEQDDSKKSWVSDSDEEEVNY